MMPELKPLNMTAQEMLVALGTIPADRQATILQSWLDAITRPDGGGSLREALVAVRSGDLELVIKAGGLWPGATGMRTNGSPEMVICIPCGASQVRAKRALEALKAALAAKDGG